ncbi:MAG: hypothetical protein Q9159_004843 [Coniocarpon cinnabarinum]
MSFGVFELNRTFELSSVLTKTSSHSNSSPAVSQLDGEQDARESSSKSSSGSSPEEKLKVSLRGDTSSKTGLYKFINSSKPLDLKASEHRKTVRSQAARLQPLLDEDDAATKARKRRRHTRLNRNVTFRIDLRVSGAAPRTPKRSEGNATETRERTKAESPRLTRSPGGGWPMPFDNLAARKRAFTPYLTVLATNIPELDLAQPGLLRSLWFPMALTEPATFQVILLTAASHYAMINNLQQAADLLQLRQETLRLINELLRDNRKACTDAAIAAIAKLASYEAQFGDPALYQIHMEGLLRLVVMRGGLSKLGLDGLLMRMLLWIDVNARHLINTPLYIASCFVDRGHELPLPNPALYIGGV